MKNPAQPVSDGELIRKQLLDICHKFEGKEFMAVHGHCDMDLAAVRCAKRVKALEKVFDQYVSDEVRRARIEGRTQALREVVDNPDRKAYYMELLNQELKSKKAYLTHSPDQTEQERRR